MHFAQPIMHPMMQEFKEATKQKSSETGITLIPNEDNLFAWKANLQAGPPHSHAILQSAAHYESQQIKVLSVSGSQGNTL